MQCSPESLDLFVLIDGSRSVGYENFRKVKKFLKKLSKEFLIGKNNARFGVMQYGHKSNPRKGVTRIEFNLTQYKSNKEVSNAIKKMNFLDSANTHTGNALSIVNKKVCIFCFLKEATL